MVYLLLSGIWQEFEFFETRKIFLVINFSVMFLYEMVNLVK